MAAASSSSSSSSTTTAASSAVAADTSSIIDQRLEQAQQLYGNASSEEGVFLAELLEKVGDLNIIEANVRRSSAPALWRFRQRFSLQAFAFELKLSPSNEQQFPVLSAFFEEEPQLRGLRHLPAVLEWQTLLLNHYSRQLDHETALNMTVSQVLANAPDKERWTTAFLGFKQAWNASWSFVEKFGCLRIPPTYRMMTMNESTPIAFSLPCEFDEGICALVLSRFLVERHNRFVQRVDELTLMNADAGRGGDDVQRTHAISSKFFTQAHALTYDLDGAFASFVEHHSVGYTHNGAIQFDFKSAEAFLIESAFQGKPLVDLLVRMMQFSDTDAQIQVEALSRKVPQQQLDRQAVTTITKELATAAAARACLDVLDTTISFLMATGSATLTLDSDLLLSTYISNVLLMSSSSSELGSSKFIHTQVKLCHLESLWRLLRSMVVPDPLVNIHAKYRAELPAAEKAKLLAAANHLDLDTLLPLFKDHMTAQLVEEHTSANGSIKEVISYLTSNDAFLSDLPWFKHFPDSLIMKYAFNAYKLLEESQT